MSIHKLHHHQQCKVYSKNCDPPETLKLLETDLQNAVQQLTVDKAVWDPNFDSVKFKAIMGMTKYTIYLKRFDKSIENYWY